MKRMLVSALVLAGLVLTAVPCRAQWGWPPPGTSAATFVASDGGCYRRLCQVLRDHRRHKQPSGACALAIPATVAAPSIPPANQPLPVQP